MAAADEILAGKLRDQFIVDVYQAGAGTSHNMNANEVLANRAAELLGAPKGTYAQGPSQRSRQHVAVHQRRVSDGHAARAAARSRPARRERAQLCRLRSKQKAREFAGVLKVGRTHLQDAVPITLGEVFGGYAACIERAADDLDAASRQLTELNLGATAVGTGLNASAELRRSRGRTPARLHRAAAAAGEEPLSRHAEHGRRRRVFRRDAAAVDRARQDRQRSATAEHGTARRACPRSPCRRCSLARRSCRAR